MKIIWINIFLKMYAKIRVAFGSLLHYSLCSIAGDSWRTAVYLVCFHCFVVKPVQHLNVRFFYTYIAHLNNDR